MPGNKTRPKIHPELPKIWEILPAIDTATRRLSVPQPATLPKYENSDYCVNGILEVSE